MRLFLCLVLSLACGCTSTSGARSEREVAGPVVQADDGPPAALAPYDALRRGHAERDDTLAASAYTADAQLAYEGFSSEARIYEGRDAIRASFGDTFGGVDPALPLDLNFRLTERHERDGRLEERGLYRLRAGQARSVYGRFEVVRDPSTGQILADVSRPATRADFEDAAGPVLLAAGDEELDPAYYDAFTGRYRRADGCDFVVTSSVVRLFVRDTCVQSWRGLSRVSGRTWTAGGRVLSDSVITTFEFAAPDATGASPSVVVRGPDGTSEAVRHIPYRTEPLAFTASDGSLLAGTLYLPSGLGPHPATVLVHGSGPQDRRGYASILGVLADALAVRGVVVLAYDKRGVRESRGQGGSFAVLGADAASAAVALRRRPEVDPSRVAMAGSSQAGWVVAKAIEQGATPAAVFLLGAAGAALSVPEQNLYNTRVGMECAGVGADDTRLALEQQQAFFAYVHRPGAATAARLDELTAEGQLRPGLADWLFPSSSETDLAGSDWFTTLELDFDPLPVWATYEGAETFVFAEHDDATPSELAVSRLEAAAPGVDIVMLDGAQHLGLRTTSTCAGDLGDVDRFHPRLLDALSTFADDLRTP